MERSMIAFFSISVVLLPTTTAYWSQWGTWSSCTRRCGIGTTLSRRHCLNSVNECSGENTRYRTCNTQDCPQDSTDFRNQQCSDAVRRDESFSKMKHLEWTAENENHHSACSLRCRALGTELVKQIAAGVLDGTRCNQHSYDVCINGECQDVGCDRQLHSGKKYDVCGICDGDGKSCRLVTGLYISDPDKRDGSEVVITVPERSRRISVSARGLGHVGFKLRDSSSIDLISPNHTRLSNQNYFGESKLVVNYEKLSTSKEYFDLPGPVPEDIEVVALYDNVVWKYIRYEFYQPLTVMWIHNETSVDCTKTCGNGLRYISPICVDVISVNRRNDKECYAEGLTPPSPKVYRCNTDPCPTSWLPDPWTDCSTSCNGGFQTRTISCTEDNEDGRSFISVDATPCLRTNLTSPATRRICNEHPCPSWKAENWSACSTTCGAGSQHRVVSCLAHDGKPGYDCEERNKPAVRRTCVVRRPCYFSNAKPLRPIRVLSEKTMNSRNAAYRGTVQTMSLLPSWNSEPWGDCSTTCGPGVMKREVRCKVILRFSGKIELLNDSQCSETKPETIQECSLGACFDVAAMTAEPISSEYQVPLTALANNPVLSESNYDMFAYEWKHDDSCALPCDRNEIRRNPTMRWKCLHKATGIFVVPLKCDPIAAHNPDCDDYSCIFSSLDDSVRWDLGSFGQCSSSCGRGVRNRSVVCKVMPEGANATYGSFNSFGKRLPDIMCPAPKPSVVEACAQSPCLPKWKAGSWSECSVQCGRGYQNRSVTCLQKLGSGKTVQVSDVYCVKNLKPQKRQMCTKPRQCPPQFNRGSWKLCRVRCQRNIVRQFRRCMRTRKAGGRLMMNHGLRRCRTKRSREVKLCKYRKCAARTFRPHIHVLRKIFIQSHPQKKVRISIGQRAIVIRGTTVIIRCQVDNFVPQNIRWFYNGSLVFRRPFYMRNHFTKLLDGSLRILRADLSDSGFYACRAGFSFARSFIQVKLPLVKQHRIPPTTPSNEQNRQTTDNHIDTNFDSYANSRIVYRFNPSPASYQILKHHYLHPDISYARAPVVKANLESNLEERELSTIKSSTLNRFDRRTSNTELSSIVEQYLEDADLQESNDQFIEVLRSLISITELYQSGRINSSDRIRRKVQVFEQLNSMLESADEKMNSRLNTARSIDAVTPLRILRLLEEQIRNETNTNAPIITSHLSSNEPLQQDRDITAYVGESLTVTHAERLTLLCETVGNVRPEIVWYHDEKLVQESSRLFILQEGSLRIVHPQFSDSGAYTCVASNLRGSDSKTTILSIMRKPRIHSITSSYVDIESDIVKVTIGSDIRAKLGAKINIKCPTEGHPDPFVVWSKDGPGLGQNTIVLPDNSLQIYPATSAYQGLFGCEASNPAGSDYQASSLVLLDAPRISQDDSLLKNIEGVIGLPQLLLAGVPMESFQVRANTSVIMGCPITGFPQPHITWFFNNQSLINLGHILDYQLMKQNRVLQIPNSGLDTVGTFSCFAVNDAGNMTASLNLNVLAYSYEYGSYSECSASCGNEGVKIRSATCTRDDGISINDRYCDGLQKPNQETKSCNRIDCPPKLFMGEWSSCSNDCGQGFRIRMLSCVVLMSDGSSREVVREECAGLNNVTEQSKYCYERLCPRWRAGSWSLCGRKCVKRGMTEKVRQVQCVNSNGTAIRHDYCIGKTKPKHKIYCRSSHCTPIWSFVGWSSCSKSCGSGGYRTRVSKCVYGGRRQQPADNQCSIRRKPTAKAACNKENCSKNSCSDKPWCSKMLRLKRVRCNNRLRKFCCQSCSS